MKSRSLWAAAAVVLCGSARLWAQDPFEIHVLQYENLQLGEFTYESHLNYHHQLHVTNELTAGLASFASIGVMQLNQRELNGAFDAIGWRVVPHFFAPKSWHLPVDAGLVMEFSFNKSAYSPDTRVMEIVPILEKNAGPFQIDFNPAFGRVIHGAGVHDGWEFEPSGRLGFVLTKRFTPSVEYYSHWHDVNQVLFGGDIAVSRHLLWSLGAGSGIFKSRLELSFGHPAN